MIAADSWDDRCLFDRSRSTYRRWFGSLALGLSGVLTAGTPALAQEGKIEAPTPKLDTPQVDFEKLTARPCGSRSSRTGCM